jgi:hypothetical protein
VEHLAGVPQFPACGIRRVQRKAAVDALAHQSQPQSVLGREEVQSAFNKLSCARTVPKPYLFSALGIALSEKQIPQVVENIENSCVRMEALERVAVLRRQMLYPAELRAH